MGTNDETDGAEFTRGDLIRMLQEVMKLRLRVRQAEARALGRTRARADHSVSATMRFSLRNPRTGRVFCRRRRGHSHGTVAIERIPRSASNPNGFPAN